MRKSFLFASILLFAIGTILLINSCQEDVFNDDPKLPEVSYIGNGGDINELWLGPIPEPTVQINKYTKIENRSNCPYTLSHASFSASIQQGKSEQELNDVCIDNIPPKADILFMMDLTHSMSRELSNLKVQSVNIMNSVKSLISDSYFGVISNMDYPTSYYSKSYGLPKDNPYKLDQSLTGRISDIETSLNKMTIGDGGDQPESYGRALFEAANDTGIGWRSGSAKIIVAMLDNIPHSSSLGTGVDPGRDNIAGTADDIDMIDIVDDLIAQNIKLIVLYSGYTASEYDYWKGVTNSTGGEALQLNLNGTIPGGGDLAVKITDLINSTTNELAEVKMYASPAEFNSWITSYPLSLVNIDLSVDNLFYFEVTYTVPAGTPAGMYEFDLELTGDGVVYGSKSVSIEVVSDRFAILN